METILRGLHNNFLITRIRQFTDTDSREFLLHRLYFSLRAAYKKLIVILYLHYVFIFYLFLYNSYVHSHILRSSNVRERILAR